MSTSDSSGTVSIVIPAYNEVELLPGHLASILDHAARRPWEAEIVVVDDGSTDGTAAEVESLAAIHREIRLLRQSNRGKGAAVRRGILAGTGRVRGFTDADGSTPIEEIDRMLEALGAGAAVAIGSRARREPGRAVRAHLHRKVLGRTFNLLVRMLLGLTRRDGRPIADTQCGFKWFDAAAAEELFRRAREDGFAFDLEILHLANRLELPIAELPVAWTDRGVSSVNLLVEPFRMLWTAARLSLRRRDL
ncbi:MAG: glycosyltransferase family 2 protein [Thermoanaerobaculia bacterium]|nr:glycosyltransferase family 2 protein [Thermoanaerobaculia bacterium]